MSRSGTVTMKTNKIISFLHLLRKLTVLYCIVLYCIVLYYMKKVETVWHFFVSRGTFEHELEWELG